MNVHEERYRKRRFAPESHVEGSPMSCTWACWDNTCRQQNFGPKSRRKIRRTWLWATWTRGTSGKRMGTLQVCGCKMTRAVKTIHLCSEQGTQIPESPQVSLPGTPCGSISGQLSSGSVKIIYYAICYGVGVDVVFVSKFQNGRPSTVAG